MGTSMNMGSAVVAPFLCVAAALRTLPVLSVSDTLGLWDKVCVDLAVVATLEMATAALLSTLSGSATLDLCLAGLLVNVKATKVLALLSTASTLLASTLMTLALGSSHTEMDPTELMPFLGVTETLMTLSALGDAGALRCSGRRVRSDFVSNSGSGRDAHDDLSDSSSCIQIN